jgi:hypothetical protein
MEMKARTPTERHQQICTASQAHASTHMMRQLAQASLVARADFDPIRRDYFAGFGLIQHDSKACSTRSNDPTKPLNLSITLVSLSVFVGNVSIQLEQRTSPTAALVTAQLVCAGIATLA